MVEFEIETNLGRRKFVRVLEVFIHHYTGEMIRRVRIDYISSSSGEACSGYKTLNEREFNEMLERRVHD